MERLPHINPAPSRDVQNDLDELRNCFERRAREYDANERRTCENGCNGCDECTDYDEEA